MSDITFDDFEILAEIKKSIIIAKVNDIKINGF